MLSSIQIISHWASISETIRYHSRYNKSLYLNNFAEHLYLLRWSQTVEFLHRSLNIYKNLHIINIKFKVVSMHTCLPPRYTNIPPQVCEHEDGSKEVYRHGNREHLEYLMHGPALADGEPDTMGIGPDTTQVHHNKKKVESQQTYITERTKVLNIRTVHMYNIRSYYLLASCL